MSGANEVESNRLVSISDDYEMKLELSLSGWAEISFMRYANGIWDDRDECKGVEFGVEKAIEIRDALNDFISANDG